MSNYRNLSNTFLQQRKRQIVAETEDPVQRNLREFKEKARNHPDRALLVPEWHLWKRLMGEKQRDHYFYPDGPPAPCRW